MKDIAIYGAGGLGREVKTILDAINRENEVYNFLGFFDDGKKGEKVLGTIADLNRWDKPIALVVAAGAPRVKKDIISKISNSNVQYETVIHPRAITGDSDTITIGEGTIIGAGTILTTDIVIGAHVLINLNVTVGHDSIIGSFTSVMPGVNIAGSVEIGDEVLIGAGANVVNAVTIGGKARIGAGAVVLRDVNAGATVVGVPAREKN